MPQNKEASARRIILDNLLRDGRGYTMQQMMNECNKQLSDGESGFREITSLNTIRTDLREIDRQLCQKNKVRPEKIVDDYFFIIMEREGRNKYYRYKNSKTSLYVTRFQSQELASIVNAVSILKRFKGMPGFEFVDGMFERFRAHSNIKGDPGKIVGFDENPDLKGKDYFTDLFQAIASQKALELTYRNFKKDVEETFTVHPYFLKQYNKRWFLFAWNEEKCFLQNFAFDRIVCVEDSHHDFIPNTTVDFETFFDDVVGVSKDTRVEPILITFWVSSTSLPYILSKPIHHSQKVIKIDADGAILTIEVRRNYEVEQLFLSYGENIKIISPESVRIDFKERIARMLENYK